MRKRELSQKLAFAEQELEIAVRISNAREGIVDVFKERVKVLEQRVTQKQYIIDLAHEYIRDALGVEPDSPRRFDWYAQLIGELEERLTNFEIRSLPAAARLVPIGQVVARDEMIDRQEKELIELREQARGLEAQSLRLNIEDLEIKYEQELKDWKEQCEEAVRRNRVLARQRDGAADRSRARREALVAALEKVEIFRIERDNAIEALRLATSGQECIESWEIRLPERMFPECAAWVHFSWGEGKYQVEIRESGEETKSYWSRQVGSYPGVELWGMLSGSRVHTTLRPPRNPKEAREFVIDGINEMHWEGPGMGPSPENGMMSYDEWLVEQRTGHKRSQ